jgi:hypothetical protein
MDTLWQLISDKGIYISFEGIILFVLFASFCLLFAKHRLGLLLSYGFVLYWIFVKNGTCFINLLSPIPWGLPIFCFACFTMVVLFLVCLFHEG